jgi:hypothetical protein
MKRADDCSAYPALTRASECACATNGLAGLLPGNSQLAADQRFIVA